MVLRFPSRWSDTPRHWRSYSGAQGVIWHGQYPHPTWTLASFSRQSTNSHTAMDREQLKTWLISSDDVGPSQAATIKFCHLHAQSRRSQRWLAVNRGFNRILQAPEHLAKSQLMIFLRPTCTPYKFSILSVRTWALLNGLHGPFWRVRILGGLFSLEEVLLSSLVPN